MRAWPSTASKSDPRLIGRAFFCRSVPANDCKKLLPLGGGFFSSDKALDRMVPAEGFEPPTPRLRSGCSTPELRRHGPKSAEWRSS
jgi:hypothetical protein